jgi:hypothetical protein
VIEEEVIRMNERAKSIRGVHPEFREGRKHFLMRVAEANAISAPELVKSGGGYGVDLARPGGESPWWKNLQQLSAIVENEEKFPRAWLTKSGRVCPLCIAANAGESSIGWETRYADACTVHGVWLVDRCACGAYLQPLRHRLDRCCDCSRKLGSLTTAPAPDAVIKLSKLLVEKACSRDDASDFALGRSAPDLLPLDQLQTLIAIIGLYGDPNAPPRRSGTRTIERLEDSWAVTSLAAEVITDWPRGFRRLLDWLRTCNDDGSTLQLGHRFGRLYHSLYQAAGTGYFHFVHAALEEYLTEHWPAVFARANGRFSGAAKEKGWMLAKEAQKKLSVSPTLLNDLIIRGLLIADRRVTATGRVRMMVQTDSVNALANSGAARGVDLTVAASKLGLGERRLRSIVTRLIPRAWKTSSGQWQIPFEDLDALLTRTSDAQVHPIVEFSKHTTLSAALKFLHLTDEGLLWIVKAVVENKEGQSLLGRHESLRGIGSWIVDRALIVQALRETAEEQPIQPEAATIRLGMLPGRWHMHPQVIHDLARLKAFETTKAKREDGIWNRVVRLEEVAKFEQAHISARQIAMCASMLPKSIVGKLRLAGIRPKYGPEGKCRQIFFARSPELQTTLDALGIRCQLDNSPMWRDQAWHRQPAKHIAMS